MSSGENVSHNTSYDSDSNQVSNSKHMQTQNHHNNNFQSSVSFTNPSLDNDQELEAYPKNSNHSPI